MAMSVGKKGGGRGRFSRPPMSEINVTPVVDVMLVLLIVFMVAAPLLTVGVPVDLPKTQAAPISGDTEPLTITINGKGEIYVQETLTEADACSCRNSLRLPRTGTSSASSCVPTIRLPTAR